MSVFALAVAFWHSFTKVFVVQFSTGKNWNLTKVFVPVEVKFYQPSCVGLPVKFSLESVLYLRVNTTVKAEVQPKFFIPLPEQVTVSGKLNIRYDLHGTMSYCTFLFRQILSIPKKLVFFYFLGPIKSCVVHAMKNDLRFS